MSYNWPNIQLVSKTHNICIRRELGKTFYHKTIEMWNSAKFAFIFSSINLFHLLFTEIFCTKGHRNFCTEALLQKNRTSFIHDPLTTPALLADPNIFE